MSFAELLGELSEALDIELVPDENGCCLLQFDGETQVQLEPDNGDLLMGLIVGQVTAGKGREMLFRAALIANGNHLPGMGCFAYSAKTDQLVLYERMPMQGLSGQVLAASIELFLEKGSRWQEALQSGTIPDPHAPL